MWKISFFPAAPHYYLLSVISRNTVAAFSKSLSDFLPGRGIQVALVVPFFFFQRKIGLLIQCNKGTVSSGGTNSHFLAQRWRQVSYKNNSAICGYCCILELVPLGGGLERDCLRTKAAQCSQDWLVP